MDDLLAARATMAFSLAFHIIFAAIGMTLPFFMATAHFFSLKKNDTVYLELTKLWLRGFAVLFVVGVVSGTALSLQLGLLWPVFMRHAGPIIGMPFSLEGAVFFLEAVCVGLFLYGWKRMPKWAHWCSGLGIGIFGFTSGILVVSVAGWMNSPSGFDWVNGTAENINVFAAMFNKAWFHQSLHMQVSAFQAVGFLVGGIHAAFYLKNRARELHLWAMEIALVFATVASFAQPIVGHYAGQRVADLQPVKFAAMEGHFETQTHAPLYIGGIPDVENRTMNYGIPLPGMLSFLTADNTAAEVKGLNDFPREEWPPVALVHGAFQVMVGIGGILFLVAAAFLFFWKRCHFPKWFLQTLIICAPLGVIAIEAGWVVTEVGRQPWLIHGILKTQDAVTSVRGIQTQFFIFVALYLTLAIAVAWFFKRLICASESKLEAEV